MSMAYGFFNSESTMVDGVTIYDRALDASFYARFLKEVTQNGVVGFEVTANDTLGVAISAGAGIVNGYYGYDDNETTLMLETATARTDLIVLRLDTANRTISLAVRKNASNPIRTSDIYELVLAKISLPADANVVTTSMITDTRNDTALCGKCGAKTGTVQSATTDNGHTIYVQQAQPASPTSGDLWFW